MSRYTRDRKALGRGGSRRDSIRRDRTPRGSTRRGGHRLAGAESLELRQMLAPLIAGDANQDYYFDEADFVQAFKAGKFETGAPATWQEGDWDGGGGAGGGGPGNPPEGDGVFNTTDFVVAFTAGRYKIADAINPYEPTSDPPKHARQPLVQTDNADVVVAYDDRTGAVVVDAGAQLMTTFHLHSTSGILTGDFPQIVQPPFDIHGAHDLFKLSTAGDDVFDFGTVASTGLTADALLADLSVDGSFFTGGGLGTVALVCDCFTGVTGVIEGQVFNDTNGNGVRDAGEAGVNRQTVELTSSQSPRLRITSTTANVDRNGDGTIDPESELGWYRFANLRPANYEVTERFAVGTVPIAPSVSTVSLTLNEADVVTVDFGVEQRALLEAGDANQDFRVDAADLIQAMKAGKYSNGQRASWAEGDWNTQTRGEIGSPPIGDGRFTNVDLVAVQQTELYRTGPYHIAAGEAINALAPVSAENDVVDALLIYNADNGDLTLRSTSPVTSLHLRSASQQFASTLELIGVRSSFDFATATEAFAFNPSGLTRIGLSGALPSGLTEAQLEADLLVDGSKLAGGGLGTVGLIVTNVAVGSEDQVAVNLFFDANADGIKDADEVGSNRAILTVDSLRLASPLVLRPVDIDRNNDGVIDPLTERGYVEFGNLEPGEYTATVTALDNLAATTPVVFSFSVAADTPTELNIGVFGFAMGDVNRDTRLDASDIDALCRNIQPDGVYSAAMDLARDGELNFRDVRQLVEQLLGTTFGDANLDGVFNSSDLVAVLQAGLYNDAIAGNASWATGDWNCDADFSPRDIVVAFQFGNYQATGPINAVAAHSLNVDRPRESEDAMGGDGRFSELVRSAGGLDSPHGHVGHVVDDHLAKAATRLRAGGDTRLTSNRPHGKTTELVREIDQIFAEEWSHRKTISQANAIANASVVEPQDTNSVFTKTRLHRSLGATV